jgi:hypothetical protein
MFMHMRQCATAHLEVNDVLTICESLFDASAARYFTDLSADIPTLATLLVCADREM